MKKSSQEKIERIIIDEMEEPLRFLVECEQVARMRGEMFGLCDCIDNAGNPYPSQAMTDLIRDAMARGIKPRYREKKINEKFSTRSQW